MDRQTDSGRRLVSHSRTASRDKNLSCGHCLAEISFYTVSQKAVACFIFYNLKKVEPTFIIWHNTA